MVDDPLDKFSDFWADPEAYLLVSSSGDPERDALVVRATSLHPTVIDTSSEITAAIYRRMLAAGVEVISDEEYDRRLSLPRWNDRSPQSVSSTLLSPAQCVRLSDGRFQLFVAGPLPALLCGYEFILARRDLAELLERHCGDALEVLDAVIFDPASKESLLSHRELRPRHELTPDSLLRGLHADSTTWHFDRSNLFVSAEVRDQIDEEATRLGIAFSPGFSQYG